ncbi:hypothetical protein TrRE_jg9655, partial [Triparma retinervis]
MIRPGTTGQMMRTSSSVPALQRFANGGFAEEKKVDSLSSFTRAQHLLDTAQQQQQQDEARRSGLGGEGDGGGGLLGSGGVLRRNSDPKLSYHGGGGGSDDNSSVGGGGSLRGSSNQSPQQQQQQQQQYQQQPPHPSVAFARPATSHAGLERGVGAGMGEIDNENLREEVKRLQLAMVDQFRGKGRFTGGSQFRARQQTPDNSERSAEMNSLRTAVKSLREQLRSLKGDYEDMESGCAQDRAARLVVEEQLRKEHVDAVSLKQELDRVRALLEATQTRVVKTPVRTERGVDNGVLSALEQRLKEEKKTTESLREKAKGLEGKVRVKTEELKETEQRKEAETKRWEEERTRLYSEIDRWRQRSTEAQKTLEGNEGKAKKENKAIEDKLRRLSKSATEKSKRALAEKEKELRKLAEEAEALRSTSDKLKELEKEHGKERRKSVAALSKAEGMGLELERLRALVEQ